MVKEGGQWTSDHWPVYAPDGKLVHDWVCDCPDPKDGFLEIDGLAFSPHGKRYATRDRLGSLILWNSAVQTKLRVFEQPIAFRQEKSYILFTMPFAFSPDGKQIAAGEPIRRQVPGKGNWVQGLHHGAYRDWDVDWVAKDFSQGHVHVWDVDTGRLVHQLPNPECGFPEVAFGKGTIIAFGGPLRVWDRAKEKELAKLNYRRPST